MNVHLSPRPSIKEHISASNTHCPSTFGPKGFGMPRFFPKTIMFTLKHMRQTVTATFNSLIPLLVKDYGHTVKYVCLPCRGNRPVLCTYPDSPGYPLTWRGWAGQWCPLLQDQALFLTHLCSSLYSPVKPFQKTSCDAHVVQDRLKSHSLLL